MAGEVFLLRSRAHFTQWKGFWVKKFSVKIIGKTECHSTTFAQPRRANQNTDVSDQHPNQPTMDTEPMKATPSTQKQKMKYNQKPNDIYKKNVEEFKSFGYHLLKV